MFKSLPSLQAHTSLISKTYPNHALASRDPKTQVVNMQESLKPVHEINFELHSQKSSFNSKGDIKGSKHLATDIMHSVNCKSEDVVHLRPTQHKTLYSCSTSSEHPLQSRPNVCGLTSDSQASFKPYFPSSGFTELKAKQPTESHLHSKETTADVSSKMPHGGGLAVGFKKTMKKPFNSLFANSIITDSLLPKDDSVTSLSRPQGLIQSPCPAPKSSRSFVSLFAAPLSAAPLPCIQSQPDHTRTSFGSEKPAWFTDVASCFSNSKRKAANLETPLKRRVKTDVREISHTLRSPQVSPDPEIGNEGSSIDCKIQRVNPACGLVYSSIREQSKCPTPCVKSQTTTHAQQLLPDILSCKEVAAKSVLRTLFQHLSPYHQDGEQQDSVQISIPPETEGKDKNSTGCVFEEQQLKSNKTGRRKKKLKTPQTTEITEQQPSLQTPHISSKAAGGSTLSRPGMTEPQVRDSGTHYLPSNTLMQHHIEPRRKTPSQERQCVNGNVGTTPLKDLFKTLDFHFGH
uniref:uncharacterized protein n=1 Tax=Semicossyphus pulcher TaxID=241346 RepID=UPI0037E8A679